MKTRAFFLSSLLLLLVALGLQTFGWYSLIASAQSALMRLWLLPIFPGMSPDNPHDSDIFRVMIWAGLALAILGLGCLVASSRRREPGSRFALGTLFTIYVGTWVFLLCTSGL
jgi:hypothetical protein